MEYPNYARQQLEGCWRRGDAHTDRTGVGGKCMQRQGAPPMRTSGPSKLECRTCCNPRLPNVTLASLAPQARITSRTCESAASCCAQPPLASPRRILHSGFPVFFPCAWSRRHLGLRAPVPSVTGSRNGLKEPVSHYATAGFGLAIARTPLFQSVALRCRFQL